jgi:hypothetical protein
MDDDLQQLEAELARLRPAAPSRALLARLEHELAPTMVEPGPSRLWWLWAGALPAAAAIALLFTLNARRAATPPAPPAPELASAVQPTFKPVAAENVLYSVRDDGLVTLEDGTAARRETLRFIDTVTWKNPRTNASVRWSVPREEVRVVPVIFQ